jgi:superfamily II DNA or RNA helicase
MQAHLARFPTDQQKMLVVAHREELLDQAADKIGTVNPHLRIDIEQGLRKASPMADVVIASVQTLSVASRLRKLDPNQFLTIIIDEAHHSTAPSYVKMLQYFGVLPPHDWGDRRPHTQDPDEIIAWQRKRLAAWDVEHAGTLLVGFTATPKRSDRVGLEAVYEEIVYSMNMRDGIDQGWLCRLRAKRILSETSLDGVSTQAGDFAIGELADAVDNEDRNALAVKGWLEHARGRKTIAFCVNVQHAVDLAEQFRKEGVKAMPISGVTETTERRRLLKAFHDGKIDVLTNCNILTEGFDEPNVQCILHARPTKSSILYVQMTGRGTRLFEGKCDCLILDVVDVTRRHSLITAPELFGLPPGFDAKGDDLVKITKKVEEAQAEGINTSELESLDDLRIRAVEVDLWTGVYNTDEVQAHASMNWMRDNPTTYTLPIRPQADVPEMLRVAQNLIGQWRADHVVGYKCSQHIATGSTLKQALQAAEAWLTKERAENVGFLDRNAAWRRRPPTSGQIALAKTLNVPWKLAQNSGELSDMISIAQRRDQQRRPRARFDL